MKPRLPIYLKFALILLRGNFLSALISTTLILWRDNSNSNNFLYLQHVKNTRKKAGTSISSLKSICSFDIFKKIISRFVLRYNLNTRRFLSCLTFCLPKTFGWISCITRSYVCLFIKTFNGIRGKVYPFTVSPNIHNIVLSK